VIRISLEQKQLTTEQIKALNEAWKRAASTILYSTSLAASGHPGGSLSCAQILLMFYAVANYKTSDPSYPDRDRLIVSNGHISPGVYGSLAEAGFFPAEDVIIGFRKAGTPFAGHVESVVPGVEWNTGNLGQGLSAGCASALAGKYNKKSYRTVVLMGDGEQQKGQISEARRFAVKYELNNLFAFIDYNKLQIGGKITKIMPQNIKEEFLADGWNVIELKNGNDWGDVFDGYRKAFSGEVSDPTKPTMLLANTVMGKGVSFMEGDEKFHGSPASGDQLKTALKEIGVEDKIEYYTNLRKTKTPATKDYHPGPAQFRIDTGTPKLYPADEKNDNRSAYGNALADLAKLNNKDGNTKVFGITCDLEVSVKMTAFEKESPSYFIESGIQEHHGATFAGRLSKEGFQVFFSTFGVFGVAETYNQQRLNDINHTNLKLVCTHVGLDVGEDGPTHQNIDYIALIGSLFGYSIFVPADPNQTDRVIRYIADKAGNYFVPMGRSKMGMILDEKGQPFFGIDYKYQPGKGDVLREGRDGYIIAIGPMVHEAVKAHNSLKQKGLSIGVINMCSIKPLDKELVIKAATTGLIVTAEDHNVNTGLGSLVACTLAESGLAPKFKKLGVSKYGTSGMPSDLYRTQGLDAEGIAATVLELSK
jgi:transketolase